MSPPFSDPDVEAVFARHEPQLRDALLRLRCLILDVAATTPGIGQLVETLKWGQPSYLTEKPKSGTTIRIDADASLVGDYALYVPCTTSLVDTWRERYPDLIYGGTRSVHFSLGAPLPETELSHCIAMAMTYHRRKY
jgi:hypothetical protein